MSVFFKFIHNFEDKSDKYIFTAPSVLSLSKAALCKHIIPMEIIKVRKVNGISLNKI